MVSVPYFPACSASGRINFWRRSVIFTSQKFPPPPKKKSYFRNSFVADGIPPVSPLIEIADADWSLLGTCHWGQLVTLHAALFVFRKLSVIITGNLQHLLLGEIHNCRLVFLGNHECVGYRYSFSLGAVSEFITVVPYFTGFIFSFFLFYFMSNGSYRFRSKLVLNIRLYFAVFPVSCSMPGVDPDVPHMLWIEYEKNWADRLCQVWVWVHTRFAARLMLGQWGRPRRGSSSL